MICKQCETDYIDVEKNFYAHGVDHHGNIRRDVICKYCTKRNSWFSTRSSSNRKDRRLRVITSHTRDLSWVRRDTEKGFLYYMTHNPFYFYDIFGKEPTKENILAEFKELTGVYDKIVESEEWNEWQEAV